MSYEVKYFSGMSQKWEHLDYFWTLWGAKRAIKKGLFSSRGHFKYKIFDLDDRCVLEYLKRNAALIYNEKSN